MNNTTPLYSIQIIKTENIVYPLEAVVFHNGERLDSLQARSMAGLMGQVRDQVVDTNKAAGIKAQTKPAKKPKAPAAPAVAAENDNEQTEETLEA
jgi:hypothetical protein